MPLRPAPGRLSQENHKSQTRQDGIVEPCKEGRERQNRGKKKQGERLKEEMEEDEVKGEEGGEAGGRGR